MMYIITYYYSPEYLASQGEDDKVLSDRETKTAETPEEKEMHVQWAVVNTRILPDKEYAMFDRVEFSRRTQPEEFEVEMTVWAHEKPQSLASLSRIL